MKSIEIQLPDKLVSITRDYVGKGIFKSESDVLCAALLEFLRRNRLELIERFAREDIEWAKEEVANENK